MANRPQARSGISASPCLSARDPSRIERQPGSGFVRPRPAPGDVTLIEARATQSQAAADLSLFQ